MTIGDKARLFTRLVSLRFLPWLYNHGYEVTFGEFYRPPEMAEIYASRGQGILHSDHELRIAGDFNLYKDGVWLKETADHAPAGNFWESLTTSEYQCCWGGRWGDGNHYSIEHNGIK